MSEKKCWKPRGAMVLLRYIKKDDARKSGSIILPTNAIDPETCEAEVVNFGAGLPGDLPTTDLHIGQRVLVRCQTSPGFTAAKGPVSYRQNGTEIVQGDEVLYMVNNRELWALLD